MGNGIYQRCAAEPGKHLRACLAKGYVFKLHAQSKCLLIAEGGHPTFATVPSYLRSSAKVNAQGFDPAQDGNLGQRRLYIMDSIARKPNSTSSVMAFLKVNVFSLRRLLLELACLPSAASPRPSSFTSLQWQQAALWLQTI